MYKYKCSHRLAGAGCVIIGTNIFCAATLAVCRIPVDFDCDEWSYVGIDAARGKKW